MNRSISPWIQLTNGCNLNCHYCYIRRNNKTMRVDLFYKILSKYKKLLSNKTYSNVYIRLAGGEPLLVIKSFLLIIEKFINTKGLRFEIITNGILLDDVLLDFLERNKEKIGLCLSYDSIDKNKSLNSSLIKALIKRGIRLSISTVIVENGKYLKQLSNFIFKNNLMWDLMTEKFSDEQINIKKLVCNIDKLFLNILKYKHDIKRLRFNGISMEINKGCGAGKELLAIDTDGKIYQCQSQFGNKQIYSLKSYCNKCLIKNYCGRGCKFEPENKNFCLIQKYYFMKGANYAIRMR